MIERLIKVPRGNGPITATCPFDGDPEKKWLIEIVGSNIGSDGNPVVNYIRNGQISFTFPTNRGQGMELTLVFYEAHESEKVEKHEAVSNIVSGLPSWGINVLSKVVFYSKKMAIGILILMVMSTAFAVVNYYVDISGFLDQYQKYNAANGARVLERTVKKVVDSLDDPFYDSPGIKAIEEEQNISYKSMFTRVDEDLYLMKNVFIDKDGKAFLMSYGDAEDKCENLGGYILPLELQQKILPKKTHITIRQWSGQPEWTGTAKGLFSDDYAINLKDTRLIKNTYDVDGLIYGDAEDIKIAARCGVLRATFIEDE